MSQALSALKGTARTIGYALARKDEWLAGRPASADASPPHPFRHARVRQIERETKSLPLAQRQVGWTGEG